ncbi:aminotransferase class IV [Actinoplanes sp. NEAU-A12]|uniref:Aminotransferase class IV n=1 Tax=Actinoplanes sandaracinus TaxID=3045177 RepID=A0ABT6WR18_9ACTN|nr:aminotransferase class IV [Actinoplanes sandaracinus]MDI6102080.1 aminotransferase class IV [Actinoplanes sandaracinus]
MTHVEINGAPPSVEALHRAAVGNHGHYTSMQVRDRAVAGLDLHLERLRAASGEVFPDSPAPSDDTIIELIGHALRDDRDASVRVTVLSGMDVMVSVAGPVRDDRKPPLRVRTVHYEREVPHLKHRATFGLTHHHLKARRAGFDDVLFTGRDGTVLEGSVWNVVFWNGEQVVWPEAPMLAGITMRVLRRALHELGVPDTTARLTVADLPGLAGAAATNSHCPDQPIAAVDDVPFPGNEPLTALLRRAWLSISWQPLDR